MKNLFVCFIIIALCFGFNKSKLFPDNTMYFRNAFTKNDDVLKIHCKSDKDDLGLHFLRPNISQYYIKFGDLIFGGTYFKCQLMHGDNFSYYKNFIAYKQSSSVYGANYLWEARDNGIYYAKNGPNPVFKFLWEKNDTLKSYL
ncbi:unnamed protein product [Cochlearia groenlandica]